MMPPSRAFRYRRWVAPLSTLLFLLLMTALSALPYGYQLGKYRQGMRSLSPRIERMLGLTGVGADLELRQKEYSAALDGLAYPADKEGEAIANELSTRLRQAVQASGLTLTSLAPQTTKPQDGGLDRYLVGLSVQGGLNQFQIFLDALNQTPRLWVDTLTIRPVRAPDGGQLVGAEVTVFAVRRGQS